MLQRIADTSVVGETCIVVVNRANSGRIRIIFSVFYESSKFNSVKNIWFFFTAESIAFSVAATLDIKYALVCPNMFVVSDQSSFRIT
jgi:hypothetical protein